MLSMYMWQASKGQARPWCSLVGQQKLKSSTSNSTSRTPQGIRRMIMVRIFYWSWFVWRGSVLHWCMSLRVRLYEYVPWYRGTTDNTRGALLILLTYLAWCIAVGNAASLSYVFLRRCRSIAWWRPSGMYVRVLLSTATVYCNRYSYRGWIIHTSTTAVVHTAVLV